MRDKNNSTDHKERRTSARGIYAAGMSQVEFIPPPVGQKYAPGTRVRIAKNLGPLMGHFPSGGLATVKYTYAHAYGGSDVKSYCLDIDGQGEVSWYDEHQLTPIDPCPEHRKGTHVRRKR